MTWPWLIKPKLNKWCDFQTAVTTFLQPCGGKAVTAACYKLGDFEIAFDDDANEITKSPNHKISNTFYISDFQFSLLFNEKPAINTKMLF